MTIGRMTKKTSSGRKKIEMKLIEDAQARHVSFCKRRTGIFSKASELVTLCGAEVAIVLFSPTVNPVPYTFGSPAFEPVIDHFLTGNQGKTEQESGNEEAVGESSTIQALRQELQDLTGRIEKQKAKKVALKEKLMEVAASTPENKLLAAEGENLTLPELERLCEVLGEVKLNMIKKDKHNTRLMCQGESSSSSNAPLAITPIRSRNPLEPEPDSALPDSNQPLKR